MQVGAVISASMLVISMILGLTMGIVWASLGRPRHALSWAIAYLLYGAEVVFVGLGTAFPPLYRWLEPFAFLCILLPATLVAIGARQRSGLPSWSGRLIGIALGVFAVVEGIRQTHYIPWLAATDGLFTSGMLALAIAALRPRDRRPEPAEWLTMVVLGAFILFELLLVFTDMRSTAHPEDQGLRETFINLYLSGLMPVFVANGIAAILLIASDLAAQLRELAANDPLTGILNRRGFQEAAIRAVANGRRHRQAITVVAADIDHFKSINDRFGHTAGDQTLRFVAERLSAALRRGDLVGRIGGEEFAMLLIHSDAIQATEAVERVRTDIALGAGEERARIPVTASFGIASVVSGGGSPEDALAQALDEADRALYRSKLEGRDRTTLAHAQG